MIYKRGKKHTYWFRFRFAGRIIHESAHTRKKTLARAAEKARRDQLELSINGVTGRRALPPTFERAAQRWMENRGHIVATNTQSVARTALKHLLPSFGPKLLCDIGHQEISDYQRLRQQSGAEGRTVNIEVALLRQVLKACDLWLPLAGKVRMLRERKDVGRALSADEEKLLLEAASGLDSACYAAIVVGLNTAMRKDEIRNLRWNQIDFGRRTLVVGKSKTEAGAGRIIPLNVTAFETLAHWAKRFPEASAEHYVFPWCEYKRVDPTRATKGWRTAWRHALRVAGFRCRFHDLRVTAITKLAEGQTSELTIMAIAGHVSRKMLEHYSRIRTDAKRTALDSLVVGSVNQSVHQIAASQTDAAAKLLN